MQVWNVVVSTRDFRRAIEVLEEFGPVHKTEFFNVLVLTVGNVRQFLEDLKTLIHEDPPVAEALGRVVPVTVTFTFQTRDAFETQARQKVLDWVRDLAGKSFHVRMHRRGFKDRIKSLEEERFLDELLLDLLDQAGTPGRIRFEDPDAILVVETVGQRAGLGLWTREDRENYPFMQLD